MKAKPPVEAPADNLQFCETVDAALARLKTLFNEALETVEKRFAAYGAGKLERAPAARRPIPISARKYLPS
ncbi:MAG TPA: hypothetical protein PK585_09685, partial [Amphiplicatus sp.]|nr:hypothetical protein [Amphiplicatus sp.]